MVMIWSPVRAPAAMACRILVSTSVSPKRLACLSFLWVLI